MMTWDSRQDIKVKFTPPNSSITMRTRLHAACNAMADPISDPFSYKMQTFLQNFDTNVLVFGSKLGFGRILDSLYLAIWRCSSVRM